MSQSAERSLPPSTAASAYLGAAAIWLFLLATPAAAQDPQPGATPETPPAPSAFALRVEELARNLANKEPRLRSLPPARRKGLLEFVVGNMMIVATHEMGHGVLAELELPNLGRDEDAADAFAILTLLKLNSAFSDRVLVEAAKGWYLSDRRATAEGEKPIYYDEHGMDLQRAYQIVCMLVGSNPEKFGELANIAKLPKDRQASCKSDFNTSVWSWETLLKPQLRTPDQAKQTIEISYGEGRGKLDIYARSFREIGFLEVIAEHLGTRYAWPRPFKMEFVTCGEPGASWRSRVLKLCYEMAQDFAVLYRDFEKRLPVAKLR